MSALPAALAGALVAAASAPWWATAGRAGAIHGTGDRPDGDLGGARPGVRTQTGAPAGTDAGRRAVRRPPRAAPGRSASSPAGPDAALLLELVAAALAAGAPVPRALSTMADALPGDVGTALRRVAGGLALGASWSTAWADAPAAVRAVGEALEPTAATGASPVPLLRSAAAAARRRRRAAGRAAAGRVGVWLVLPLGLCFLPAFLLLGVVPVVLSMADGLLG